MSVEVIGWVSSILFAFCGLPQAIMSYKQGHSRGIASLMLWMWFIGEVLAIVYVLGKIGIDKPLLFNYTVNILFLIVVIRYKYKERSK